MALVQGVYPRFIPSKTVRSVFLRFTSGATPADLWLTGMAANPFSHIEAKEKAGIIEFFSECWSQAQTIERKA